MDTVGVKGLKQQVTNIMLSDERVYCFVVVWNCVAVSWHQKRVHLSKPRLQVFAPRGAVAHVVQRFM